MFSYFVLKIVFVYIFSSQVFTQNLFAIKLKSKMTVAMGNYAEPCSEITSLNI